jgi:hypothetical protein
MREFVKAQSDVSEIDMKLTFFIPENPKKQDRFEPGLKSIRATGITLIKKAKND